MASNSSSDSDVVTSTTSMVCFSGEKTKMSQGTTLSWIIENMEGKIRSFRPGKGLKTDIFSIKNTKWYCKLWPNGSSTAEKDNIALALFSENDERIIAKCECKVGKDDHGLFRNAHFTHEFTGKGQNFGFPTLLSHGSLLQKKNQLTRRGRMEFTIKISIVEEFCTPSPQIRLMEDSSEINQLRKLSENFSNLLLDENSSDFLILCGDDKFPVHRNVLKSRSSYFNGLLNNDFMESNNGHIVIENMDSETVRSLIEYIYTGRFKDLETMPILLLKAADMYDFPLLKKSCEDELISNMNLENVVDLFVLAEDHNATELRLAATELRLAAKKMILENKAVIVEQDGWDAKLGTLVIELFKAI